MKTVKEIIRRFAASEYSFNDYSEVKKFFNDEGHDLELKECLYEDWNNTSSDSNNSDKLKEILQNLHSKIEAALPPEKNVKEEKTFFVSFRQVFSKIAAVLFIPFLLSIAFFSYITFHNKNEIMAWAEIHSPLGSRTEFQLPDGTKGWLNSGSTLKYPLNFTYNRRVELTGEAWLDVAHIDLSSFKVHSSNFDVRVTGTILNVVSYENDNLFEVILQEGSVVVENHDTDLKMKLEPNQRLLYNKDTKELFQTKIDSETYSNWKDGVLTFRNEPMSEIARRLEHRYNAKITLHGEELKSSVFRATFQDENIEEICKLLSTVAPIKYTIHDRRLNTNDTYAPYEIEMWLIK